MNSLKAENEGLALLVRTTRPTERSSCSMMFNVSIARTPLLNKWSIDK